MKTKHMLWGAAVLVATLGFENRGMAALGGVVVATEETEVFSGGSSHSVTKEQIESVAQQYGYRLTDAFSEENVQGINDYLTSPQNNEKTQDQIVAEILSTYQENGLVEQTENSQTPAPENRGGGSPADPIITRSNTGRGCRLVDGALACDGPASANGPAAGPKEGKPVTQNDEKLSDTGVGSSGGELSSEMSVASSSSVGLRTGGGELAHLTPAEERGLQPQDPEAIQMLDDDNAQDVEDVVAVVDPVGPTVEAPGNNEIEAPVDNVPGGPMEGGVDHALGGEMDGGVDHALGGEMDGGVDHALGGEMDGGNDDAPNGDMEVADNGAPGGEMEGGVDHALGGDMD